MAELIDRLEEVLTRYSKSFSEKKYVDEFNETDVLMNAFGISQELKSENKQYWGRELGKCWENLIRDLFEATCTDFQSPKKFGADEPADFFVGKDAIDTKYRVGSGDSGTLKKFEQYGNLLVKKGFRPVFLFLRTDNLPAALSKMDAGGWTTLMGDASFQYIKEKTDFDLKAWLIDLEAKETYKIDRDGN
jgi:hypothetical protein